MDTIHITDNPEEMKKIAREIIAEKPHAYPQAKINMIDAYLRDRMPDATQEEIEDTFLITVYHFWVYGCTYQEYFYYDFAHKTHEEKQQYMTLRLRLRYMDHINKKEDKHLLFNKYETYQLLKEYYKRDVILCASCDDYATFCSFTDKHPEFVVKPTDMSGGRGVHKADVLGLNEAQKRDFFEKLLVSGEENKAIYLRGKESSVVLEELIDQADELAVFNPESVNCVRLITVRVNGTVHAYESWLKIGTGGLFLNSAVSGSLLAGIDTKTGIINTIGMNEMGVICEEHPDTHITIKGFQIPSWTKLLAVAEECANKVPQFSYVGWDFVLTKKQGWCIMEANYSGDFMWQLYRGKGMKEDFEELIGWKLDKDFWWQGL